MEPQVVGALISLGGVGVGLVGRDLIMALYLSKQKQEADAKERSEARARARHDLVRLYADPLREAGVSLRNRLGEITDTAQGRYLLASAPQTKFTEYKRISTLYRLAALLGWIRAFRRERSYLDPEEATPAEEAGKSIGAIEVSLADGQHVEQQRLNELAVLWHVALDKPSDLALRSTLATEIDAARRDFLSERNRLSPSDLEPEDRLEIASRCARLIGDTAKADIPDSLVRATVDQATVYLGIKEAYIYRDWQAAIGDLMIFGVASGRRRFDVMGFGEFENRYLAAQSAETPDKRWFDRLEALFHDLDMGKTGIFDARREQIRQLHAACNALLEYLDAKIVELKGVPVKG